MMKMGSINTFLYQHIPGEIHQPHGPMRTEPRSSRDRCNTQSAAGLGVKPRSNRDLLDFDWLTFALTRRNYSRTTT